MLILIGIDILIKYNTIFTLITFLPFYYCLGEKKICDQKHWMKNKSITQSVIVTGPSRKTLDNKICSLSSTYHSWAYLTRLDDISFVCHTSSVILLRLHNACDQLLICEEFLFYHELYVWNHLRLWEQLMLSWRSQKSYHQNQGSNNINHCTNIAIEMCEQSKWVRTVSAMIFLFYINIYKFYLIMNYKINYIFK